MAPPQLSRAPQVSMGKRHIECLMGVIREGYPNQFCQHRISRCGLEVECEFVGSLQSVNQSDKFFLREDQIIIIGVPCKGMIDRHKIEAMFDTEIEAVTESDGKINIKGDGVDKTIDKKDVLQQNCTICTHRNPVIYDELAADLVEEQTDVDKYEDVRRIEDMTPQEKWEYFENLLSTCIRCYACRNACPLCYCPTCFVDESRPQWVGKSQDPTDIRTFHFLRAYHCAGRCTDCGACERACPMGIKVRILTKKLEKDCLELFDWESGLTLEKRPPLDTYRPDDPDDFIK